jgi:NitT/TauT family transport system substrate-binding protein/putative hydroxymethylpyrimidine transport system substrate-binding protein
VHALADRRTRAAGALLGLAVLVLAGCGGGGGARNGGRVVVALDFTPNAAHAPIYLAHSQGFDRRQGVTISIRTPGTGPDSLKLLTSGRADIGVLDINDLGLARERGDDVVGIAALVQRPLAALIAQPGINRPRDLEGKRVGVSGLPSDPAFLQAILSRDGASLSQVHQVTIGFGAVAAMINRRVAAVPAFWNAEGVALRQHGIPVREFRVDDYGAPRYPEVVLTTTRQELKRRRGAIERALAAIAQGVRSELASPGLATRVIAAAAGEADPKLIRAQVRALASAVLPPLRLDRQVLDRWSAFDARTGLLPRRLDVASAFDFSLVH